MGKEAKIIEDLRAEITQLARVLDNRDNDIERLVARNRNLRNDLYKYGAELLRVRRVLKDAGMSDAAADSAGRVTVRPPSFETAVDPIRSGPRNW